jgi:hypothetical protein
LQARISFLSSPQTLYSFPSPSQSKNLLSPVLRFIIVALFDVLQDFLIGTKLIPPLCNSGHSLLSSDSLVKLPSPVFAKPDLKIKSNYD